ncbi:MAG: hypothetical protein JKY54_18245 [Flavobacteriales bacterium]|nr:hypothetical protein [Flavobacteriales bacterium]
MNAPLKVGQHHVRIAKHRFGTTRSGVDFHKLEFSNSYGEITQMFYENHEGRSLINSLFSEFGFEPYRMSSKAVKYCFSQLVNQYASVKVYRSETGELSTYCWQKASKYGRV